MAIGVLLHRLAQPDNRGGFLRGKSSRSRSRDRCRRTSAAASPSWAIAGDGTSKPLYITTANRRDEPHGLASSASAMPGATTARLSYWSSICDEAIHYPQTVQTGRQKRRRADRRENPVPRRITRPACASMRDSRVAARSLTLRRQDPRTVGFAHSCRDKPRKEIALAAAAWRAPFPRRGGWWRWRALQGRAAATRLRSRARAFSQARPSGRERGESQSTMTSLTGGRIEKHAPGERSRARRKPARHP